MRESFVDLGMSPLCESYVPAEKVNHMEPFYPLHVSVCGSCFLVQLEQYVAADEIFTEYAYFSSFAASWVKHAADYTAAMIDRFRLGKDSFVVELASNDGYLLQHFVKRGVPCLGIEPAANVARAAEEKGVRTLVRFFDDKLGKTLAAEGRSADLIAGNNVLAQVPDVNSFVAGIHHLLKPSGVATLEFPHLQRLMEQNQFDTIYHEHFCYFSLLAVEKIFERNGLSLFDVEELWTHGGSIRIYATRKDGVRRAPTERLLSLRRREQELGFGRIETYRAFEPRVRATKRRLLELLIRLQDEGKKVVGYGAPGKGNTLLNYCGIRTDLLAFTVDKNPYKQGRFLPGTHIPIHAPEKIEQEKPDYILILPWNFKDEILAQLAHVRSWGARFIVPIPEPAVVK